MNKKVSDFALNCIKFPETRDIFAFQAKDVHEEKSALQLRALKKVESNLESNRFEEIVCLCG